MIPQSTPLYLVTCMTVSGNPYVDNQLVIGWAERDGVEGYMPIVVGVDSYELPEVNVTMARTVGELKTSLPSGEWELRARFYRTEPGTFRNTCFHDYDVEHYGVEVCATCGEDV